MPVPHAKRVHFQCAHSNVFWEIPTRDGRRSDPPARSVIETGAVLRSSSWSGAEIANVTSRPGIDPNVARLVASLASERTDATYEALLELRSKGVDTDVTAQAALAALASARNAVQEQLRATLTKLVTRAEEEALDADVDQHLRAARKVRTRASEQQRRITRLAPRLTAADAAVLERAFARDAELLDETIATLERAHAPRATTPPVATEGGATRSAKPSDATNVDDDALLEEDLAEMRKTLRARLAGGRAAPQMDLANRVAFAIGNPLASEAVRADLQSALHGVGIATADPGYEFTKALDGMLSAAVETPILHPALVSPLGFLHLEKISYSPAGVEHGELVSSVPLAPGEEVAIVHKEWSNTEEEFSELVADQFEDYSEKGVVDKTDMAEASSTQRNHSTGFSVSVSASGGFGPMSGSASTSYSANDSESASRQSSVSQSHTTTQKASARARKEHRTSFRLAKKTHVEDQTVRRIKNPDPLNPVRFDFFQIMRKWRVDLHRYGVRLTYDLTVPQPAVDLLRIYNELRSLEDATEKAFEFKLSTDAIARDTWMTLARRYGAEVEPPPPEKLLVAQSKIMGPDAADDPYNGHVDEIRVAVPDGYYPDKWYSDNLNLRQTDENWKFTIRSAQSMDTTMTEMVFPIYRQFVMAGIAWVCVTFDLRAPILSQWKTKTYNALRAAAHAQFLEARAILEQRRTRLLAELEGIDALRLRRLEREELMKAVLRWMFGPKLNFFSQGTLTEFMPSGRVPNEQLQASALAQGRLVSFLHQAIEWENINYFLYPYFWTLPSTWSTRLRLKHSDSTHEAFLRSGAARVVLPIRRGWEKSFVAFLETGAPEATLPGNHPYMTIAEELEAFANTTYPGVIPANPTDIDPDDATKKAEGVLVASWYEYTPTSALDIKLGAAGPMEGAFVNTTWKPESLMVGLAPVRAAFVNVLNGLAARLTPRPPEP